MYNLKLLPGSPFPLGATYMNGGVNFAIFTEYAEKVEVCLFSKENTDEEYARIELMERTDHTWHGRILGLRPGQLYAYRVHGPYDPHAGHRFNPNKLLLDPYAKAIAGKMNWRDELFGYEIGHPDEDLSFSTTNSGPYLPKCVVVNGDFDWEDDKYPKIAYHQSVFYEMHIKGFSKLNERLPENLRGTYAGLSHPESITYLKELGITAVELMPVQQFVADRHLVEKGLTNYWGYNTIGFFAPECTYSAAGVHGEQVNEFKSMVKALHKEGIEVILDVVYNHTGEGNHLGPTLSFRGVDNAAYYRLEENKRYYTDYTGTGNTLHAYQPQVLKLIMDSLRYWINEMHVDGFRFDLAATLARELKDANALSGFFDIIYQDPVISTVKLIAEPWDLGEGGYMVGQFPPGWAEWNDKFRDCMRDFWRGETSRLGEFGNRFTGSSDIYKDDYRNPTASINLITAHDGFTLNDLVSYNNKHNEANKDENRDGIENNHSWNCGEEGETRNREINSLRLRQKKNLLATLLLSQGVPMLLAGDEFGNTQHGNNNAYCQDNERSWLKWAGTDEALLEYTRTLIRFRKNHPVFSRRGWFKGWTYHADHIEDIAWFHPTGKTMSDEEWQSHETLSLMVYLDGNGIDLPDENGNKIIDDSFLLCFNASDQELEFTFPEKKFGDCWTEVMNTALKKSFIKGHKKLPGDALAVKGRSIRIFSSSLKC